LLHHLYLYEAFFTRYLAPGSSSASTIAAGSSCEQPAIKGVPPKTGIVLTAAISRTRSFFSSSPWAILLLLLVADQLIRRVADVRQDLIQAPWQ
jgi:hypothetical protein